MLLKAVGSGLHAMVNMNGQHLSGPLFSAGQQQCR
jgi:hypothetical protein